MKRSIAQRMANKAWRMAARDAMKLGLQWSPLAFTA